MAQYRHPLNRRGAGAVTVARQPPESPPAALRRPLAGKVSFRLFTLARPSAIAAHEPLYGLVAKTLLELWRALQACVNHDAGVIMQAQNTSLTDDATPDAGYDRSGVVINPLKLDGIQLLDRGKQVVSLPGGTLSRLKQQLKLLGREPHSVIGSGWRTRMIAASDFGSGAIARFMSFRTATECVMPGLTPRLSCGCEPSAVGMANWGGARTLPRPSFLAVARNSRAWGIADAGADRFHQARILAHAHRRTSPAPQCPILPHPSISGSPSALVPRGA